MNILEDTVFDVAGLDCILLIFFVHLIYVNPKKNILSKMTIQPNSFCLKPTALIFIKCGLNSANWVYVLVCVKWS